MKYLEKHYLEACSLIYFDLTKIQSSSTHGLLRLSTLCAENLSRWNTKAKQLQVRGISLQKDWMIPLEWNDSYLQLCHERHVCALLTARTAAC